MATLLAAACAVNAANIVVNVAPGSSLTFQNNNLNASVGDVITFVFKGGNHSVTRSSLANPCTHLSGGFASGFDTARTEYNITVNDTSPIWYFCSQKSPLNHCQTGPMVGVINVGNNSFSEFQKAAKGLANSSTTSTASPTNSAGSGGSRTSTTSGNSPSASGASGTNSSSSSASAAAVRIGGSSTLGALTAMALLVGLTL